MSNIASIFDSSKIFNESYIGDINSISNYRDSSLSESYFSEVIKFVQETNEEFNNTNKKFYKTILESDNDYISITEAFDGFFDSIKKIVNKIIEFIKTLWDKFVVSLNKFFNSEKYLNKHLDDLKHFGSDDNFSFDGFEFTITDACPAKNVIPNLMGFDNSDNNKGDLDTADLNNPTKVQGSYDKLIANLEDDWYDIARAKILGKDTISKVYADEYSEELFKIFRNDELHKQELEIDTNSITTYKVIFKNHKDVEKEVKKTKNALDKEYEAIKKGFDSAIKRIGDNYSFIYKTTKNDNPDAVSISNETVRKTLELYTKAKSDQIVKLSNLHLLAFGAKLDAVKDQTRQAKQILYKALYKVQNRVNSKEV